ncbi:hypothetical protein FF36_06462, partial [Frankia torreyi]
MRVGLAHTPALRRALLEAGVRPWTAECQLDAGDILILDPTLDPRALLHVRGLLLPDVEVLVLIGETQGSARTTGWPWRRLRLPRDRDELLGLRTVLPATAVIPIAEHPRPITLRLEVRDSDRGTVGVPDGAPAGRGDPVLDGLRVAFEHTGLPWPHAAALTVRWAPAHQPQDREASLAVAAALLAATGTVPPAALRRYAFVGDVTPDGYL